MTEPTEPTCGNCKHRLRIYHNPGTPFALADDRCACRKSDNWLFRVTLGHTCDQHEPAETQQ